MACCTSLTSGREWSSRRDDTFLVIEGGLVIEFELGEIQLAEGQMATIPRGLRHRTRPLGHRSVNLTFEAANTETEPKSI
jgi:mannose-6-phosphate isomerase-like protein (cupin superfamily)